MQRRIEASRGRDQGDNLLWQLEIDRVRKIVLKLARGHVAYELYPNLDEPLEVVFARLSVLSDQEPEAFEDASAGNLDLWPELGSRAFLHALGKKPDQFEQMGDWIVVQQGRYRNAVAEMGGVLVRMVLSEYSACVVAWE